MLWSVRQAFRHYQRATCVYPGRRAPPLFLILLTPSRMRWVSLAVASRHILHAPQIGVSPAYPDTSSLDAVHQLSRKPKLTREEDHIVVDSVEFSVDALYALWVQGKLDITCIEVEQRDLVCLLRDCVKARELAISMVRTPRPQRSRHVLCLAHHFGCKCKPSLYETVAHALATARKWSLIPRVSELCQEHIGRTTVRLLNWRLRAYMELGEFSEVENVAAEFGASHLQLNRLSYHLFISAHLRNRNLLKAKEYIVKMERAGIPMDASTHALVASVYRYLGLDVGVQARALTSLQELDARSGTAVLNSLIRTSLDKGDVDSAIEYISFLEDPGRGLERRLVDGVVSTRLGDETTTSHTSDRIPVHVTYPTSPDVATFTMLVEHMGRLRQLARIPEVLRRMDRAGIHPDEVFAEVLVRAYVLGGDTANAIKLVYGLCAPLADVRPLFSRLGLSPWYHRVDILPSALRPTGRIFNALLQGVLETHGLMGLRIVSQIMAASGLDPDETFVETILSYMARTVGTRPWQLILALKKMTKAVPANLRHSLIVLSAIVRQESVLVRKGAWYATWKNLQYSKYQGHDAAATVPPAVPSDRLSTISETFDPLAGLTPPQRPSYITLFRPVIESLISRGIRSDKAAIALRIRHDAVVKRDVSMAEASFQQMLDRGLHPNRFHYTALMEGYVQSGDMGAARTIITSATKAGYLPDVVMYTILLVGYAYQGRPTLVARIFQKMVINGVTPDGKAIGVLANAYAAVGEYTTARRVLLELWHYVGRVPDEVREVGYNDLLKAFNNTVASRSRAQPTQLAHRQRRTIRWKVHMHLWRIIIPRLQRMNPYISWSKRSQVSTLKQQKKLVRRRLNKQGDVLDRSAQYTKIMVC